MKSPTRPSLARTAATLAVAALLTAPAAQADQLWNWSYSGSGVSAGGTLTTSDTADASGHYSVLGITGQRNGVSITGLFPTGSAIPGNEGYPVDNLLAAGSSAQFSEHGLGYTLADGSYANPYWALWATPDQYYEVHTGPGYFEAPISFSATPAVPEPGAVAMMALGLAFVAGVRRRRSAR